VWSVVEQAAKEIGIERFGAHDLRRYAERRIMPNHSSRVVGGGLNRVGRAA